MPESRHPRELRHRNLCAKQLPQHQMKQVQLRSYGLLESHQLKQAAGRRTRRPGVGMMHVQQKTLHGKRQWKLSRRNLRANQLPQHQVLGGLKY